MTEDGWKKVRERYYDVGYGKPPVSGRFVKGVSGNPRGRPKKERPAKPAIDPATRDKVLEDAARTVTVRENGTAVEMTVFDAVTRSETVAALKGSPLAQKNFLDRLERYKSDLGTEIEEDKEFWRFYVEVSNLLAEGWRKAGVPAPEHWPHPDDLVLDEGSRVTLRGGDPPDAERSRDFIIRLRDTLVLQFRKDDLQHGAAGDRGKSGPIYVSLLLAHLCNMALPKRLRLDDFQFLMRTEDARKFKKRELQRRLRLAWADLGIPEGRDLVTPPVEPLLAKFGIEWPKPPNRPGPGRATAGRLKKAA